jgi:tripartite-type tricarboxylate transporter receptor subunit TctC
MTTMLHIVLALTVLTLPAEAQEGYPARNITMIIPFAAGGSSDVIGRVVGEELGKALGQTIVFENVAGAGGSTGLSRAAAAKPDGYTIAIGNTGTNAAAYTIYPDIKYKPADFVVLGLIARTASVIAVGKDFAARTVPDFIEFARRNPGAIKLGHAGVGSSNFVICQSFVKAADINVTLVSYRGAAPALNDAIGGHIDGVCDAATSLMGAMVDGQVRGLVVGGAAKLAALPAIPNATEAGIPSFQAGGWNALFAPAGTPAPIVKKLNDAILKALASDFVAKRFADLSSTVPGASEATPDAVAALITKEIDQYKSILAPATK